jgi:GNAT superfamily N-acetyltransferase
MVLPSEYHKYRTHLKALDQESRTLRFANPYSDYLIDQFCDGVEANHKEHVLFAIEDNELNFIAIGHICLAKPMELAFSVLKEYQGQGLGGKLLSRCVQWCRTHNILEGTMVCLPHNSAMRHLCRKHKIEVTIECGEALADIKLPSAEVSTYLHETLDNNLGILDYWRKRALAKSNLLF